MAVGSCIRIRRSCRHRTSRPPLQFARSSATSTRCGCGFKGGKGVATGFGVFLGIAPLSALVALIAFILVFAISRYVSLASIVAAIVFPLAALLRHHEPLTPFMIAVVILLPLLIIAKHHANIRRLLAGTEYRFGKSKAAAA